MRIRSLRGAALLGVLVLIACHDASRENPVDPQLTPGVELVSVDTDSLRGTATLTWSQYSGEQAFQTYRIVRRVAGQTAIEQRGAITDVAVTTFVDAEVEAGRTYVYSVSVVNTAGLEVSGNSRVVSFSFAPPRLEIEEFSSLSASATLSWNRAVSGFHQYEIQRQVAGSAGPVAIHTTAVREDTTFVDTGLDGNTEYTYTVTTRTNTGEELTSAPVSGRFHDLLRKWTWEAPTEGIVRWLIPDPSGGIYASFGPTINIFELALLEDPDQIYHLDSQGALVGQFPSETATADGFFQAGNLAADDQGVYVLLKEPFPPVLSAGPGTSATDPQTDPQMQAYVNAFAPGGELRYRWPADSTLSNLSNISVSRDGVLWVSQARKDVADEDLMTLYKLNASTGDLMDTFTVEGIFVVPYFDRTMVADAEVIVVKGVVDGEARILLLDSSTGQILSATSGLSSQTDPDNVVDLSLGTENRLFLLYSGPPRVEVVRDGALLTTLANIDEASEWIGVDARGNIHVATFDPVVIISPI